MQQLPPPTRTRCLDARNHPAQRRSLAQASCQHLLHARGGPVAHAVFASPVREGR